MYELVKIDVSFEYAPKVYVYKRESGWFWKFELPNGKWFYGRAAGDDEKSAKRNASKKERELAKGLFTQKEVDKLQTILTFEEAINEFIDELKAEDRSPRYYKDEKKKLNAVANTFMEKYKKLYVHKVTEDDAFIFRKDLLLRVKNKEIKRVTAFGTLNSAKRLFKWLRKRKKIPFNPWIEVEAISVPREERARSIATPRETLTKLLEAKYKHRYEFPIKEFAYGLFRTGARKEELLFMEISDVDWQTGKWTIKSKNCPTKHGEEWRPKYGKSRVTIIPQDMLMMLKPLVKRALDHKVVGYTPNRNGKQVAVDAQFIFTMLDRKLSKASKKVYRRVDEIRGAWGALFIAAGLAEPKESYSGSTKKYKDGIKKRTDVKIPYTRHDMRRGFNLEAKRAGMSLDDRALVLGHSKEVNENHYLGRPEFDADKIAEIINNKMVDNSKRLKVVG